MKVALVKGLDGALRPDTDADQAALRSVKAGQVVVVELTKPRNTGHHRKLFALLNVMAENQDSFDTFEHMLTYIKVKAGHYSEYFTPDGDLVYLPRSISYGSMSQIEFDIFYSRVVDIAVGDPRFMQGVEPRELNAEIERRLAFA